MLQTGNAISSRQRHILLFILKSLMVTPRDKLLPLFPIGK